MVHRRLYSVDDDIDDIVYDKNVGDASRYSVAEKTCWVTFGGRNLPGGSSETTPTYIQLARSRDTP